jgi:hypothetical protein
VVDEAEVAVDMEVVGDEVEEVAVTAEEDTVEEEVVLVGSLLCFHRPINLH